MPLDIILGAQWGDEGKGRVVDLLTARADYVARFNGGDNAGHTVTVGAQTFKLHLIPSGVIHPQAVGVIGNGVVVNPRTLLEEIAVLEEAGVPLPPERLRISHAAHIITPAHRALDAAQEAARGAAAIGTTLRGIGPAYTDKVTRCGLRMYQMLDLAAFEAALRDHVSAVNRRLAQLYQAEPLETEAVVAEYCEYARRLQPYIAEVSILLTNAIKAGQRVLAEGAQGALLDLDHGTYPFVTSSYPTAAGALHGLGLGPGCAGRIIGVTKAFQTRVGAGPFPSELSGELAARLRGSGEHPWDEYGTTTGRPRRVGWLDLVLLRYAARINGLSELTLTKLDVLSGLHPLKLCVAYQAAGAYPSGRAYPKGRLYPELPYGPADLEPFEPLYEELPGWEEDVSGARRWEDLPAGARAYILRIEELSGVPVQMVSVGPERAQVVLMEGNGE